MEFFGLSLMMMFPAGTIIIIVAVAYLIYNRIRAKKKETFEKRDS